MAEMELVSVGKVLRHQGNKGEMRVLPYIDKPDQFERFNHLYLEHKILGRVQRKIKGVRSHGKFIALLVEGCGTMDDARAFSGSDLMVEAGELEPLPEGEYYWYQLEGLEVYCEDGAYLGILDSFYETGSNDVYVVRNGSKEALIPATTEVIREIDIERKKIVIRPMEGLLD